jgi:hypothetical protein
MAVNDLFDGLFPCKFRDVSFPVTNITTEFSHDQVVHERPDKDGAKVEATGRKALQISATAVFYNFIVPGKKEEWQGPLYPGVYNRFIVAFADRRTGVLVHPLRGEIRVKPVSFKSSLTADTRGGESVEVTWIETSGGQEESNAIYSYSAGINTGIKAAASLDGALGLMNPDPRLQNKETEGFSFEKAMRDVQNAIGSVQRITDQAYLKVNQYLSKINAILYRVTLVMDSIERLGNVQSWPAVRSGQALIANLRLLAKSVEQQNRVTKAYIVQTDMTLGLVAKTLNNDPGDIIMLNPRYAGSPVIAKGSLIRYYPKS